MENFIWLADLSPQEIYEVLDLAAELKEEWGGGGNRPLLAGETLGMIFQKPSLRTRVSFEVGMDIWVATPPGYEPQKEVVAKAKGFAQRMGSLVALTHDPQEAVRGADIVYTDGWASMGQEEEKEERLKAFPPYQVNPQLVAQAGRSPLVMHCLPAHRGEEITDEVIDGPYSIVYTQAENRLHLQKAILLLLMGGS